MKTKRKTAGFFIVEILIVLLIIGILVVALLPNYTTYTNRAKFVDVIMVAESYKDAVNGCIVQLGTVSASCDNGSYGIPGNIGTTATTNVAASSGAVADGIITATGVASPGPGAFTYTLTPTFNASSKTVTWAGGGTCLAEGLC